MTYEELFEQLKTLDKRQLKQRVVVMDSDCTRQEVSTFGDDVDAADNDFSDDQLYLFYD